MKWLPKFPKKMKDVNNDDTMAEYRAFENLRQFIEKSVIGDLHLFKIKGTTFILCIGTHPTRN